MCGKPQSEMNVVVDAAVAFLCLHLNRIRNMEFHVILCQIKQSTPEAHCRLWAGSCRGGDDDTSFVPRKNVCKCVALYFIASLLIPFPLFLYPLFLQTRLTTLNCRKFQ